MSIQHLHDDFVITGYILLEQLISALPKSQNMMAGLSL